MIKKSSDKLHEECGVFGLHSCSPQNHNAASLIYYGLIALQHRGQESAGISVFDDGRLKTEKGMGLVIEVFDEAGIRRLGGSSGVGHVRYSTTGGSDIKNAQPLTREPKPGETGTPFALVHNGNLTNTVPLKEFLTDMGEVFETTNDTEIILKMLSRRMHKGIIPALKSTISLIQGSFSLLIQLPDQLVAVRDPYGIRPLVLGRKDDTYFVSSESCGIDAVGGELIRDIEPGEILSISSRGIESRHIKNTVRAPCSFEFIYFSRPDSVMEKIDINQFRFDTGKLLYEQNPIEADLVMGVPDSGVPAALGYAAASGIEFRMGIVKNRYVGRTFIRPDQKMREQSVQEKLNPVRTIIEGKRIIVIDDSLVRGTTSKKLVDMLRKAGAKEVHFRSASPPIKHSCYFGIDTPNINELIANRMSVEETSRAIGADSLDYLSVENLSRIFKGRTICNGCFTGTYPALTPMHDHHGDREIPVKTPLSESTAGR